MLRVSGTSAARHRTRRCVKDVEDMLEETPLSRCKAVVLRRTLIVHDDGLHCRGDITHQPTGLGAAARRPSPHISWRLATPQLSSL
ncbi:unnamed protein product [Merluccius merluccius]